MEIRREPREPSAFPSWRFETLDFDYDAATRSAWMSFKADGPPCFTLQTLNDLADVGASLRALFADEAIRRRPVHYVALASNKPGVFNLGGDLALFADAIRAGRREALRAYAHACIDVLHAAASAYDLPIIVIAVVTGQALGGGFEAALAHDVLFADEDATLGVPEVGFNSFPGMGAVTLLARRLGAPQTERLIAGGSVHSAAEMLHLGAIDRLSRPGRAKADALSWMVEGGDEGRARRMAIMRARRICLPVVKSELIRIVDVWTDTSCNIGERDLRYMGRLVAAQHRKNPTI